MRVCNVCKENKDLDNYHNCKSFPLGKTYTCKPCAKLKSRQWNKNNAEKKAASGRQHYKDNKQDYIRRAKEANWQGNNRDKVNARARAKWAENPAVGICKNANRRAARLNATPPWLTEKQLHDITVIYNACAKVSERTGKPHHVDHVVPLQGENICGLHVSWNLAIIPAKMNLSKSNTY